ncbi:aminoglycoside phosphotransferase family protein [Deinococcus pimensis]|uniref:aminoglycoside phosphotransferase family protein n=1 Tax=Deinococcus pimensis TaxID=309888 RepID=UPI000485409A|nr:aminoglycoside phosphotransferase family protein [Deinococcus pimensis]
MPTAPFDPDTLTPGLVRQLITTQFPHWAHLPIEPASPQGWDNRTFRLGNDLCARLPSARGYVPQVAKEHRWLPVLAASLPWNVPVPVALGQPSERYPYPWSVYGWLEGQPASPTNLPNLSVFASDVARFLRDLRSVPPGDGPRPGLHSAFRGGPLATYDEETTTCLNDLEGEVDTHALHAVWTAALDAPWDGHDVWFHGDVAVNNLLVHEGRLRGVIDFGCCGVGDPACDLVLAWTLFEGESRAVFKAELGNDERTWSRARGWAVWKALLQVRDARRANDEVSGEVSRAARRVLREVLLDHAATRRGGRP